MSELSGKPEDIARFMDVMKQYGELNGVEIKTENDFDPNDPTTPNGGGGRRGDVDYSLFNGDYTKIFSPNKEDFDKQIEVARDRFGIVRDNLATLKFKITPLNESGMNIGNAKDNYPSFVDENLRGTMYWRGDESQRISIGRSSRDKFIDDLKKLFIKYDKQKNKDSVESLNIEREIETYLHVAEKFKEVFDNAELVETHLDTPKEGVERPQKGEYNPDTIIHRMYSAVSDSDGNVYRVKFTVKETRDAGSENNLHSYEVNEIEMDYYGRHERGDKTPIKRSEHNTTSIDGANLLKNVKKSKEKEVNLLDASVNTENKVDKDVTLDDIHGLKIIGYRYGKAPESGRSYNTREGLYESGVSMASVGYNEEAGSFAADANSGEGVHYYKGEINRITGGDDEICLNNVEEISKEEYERTLPNFKDISDKVANALYNRKENLVSKGFRIDLDFYKRKRDAALNSGSGDADFSLVRKDEEYAKAVEAGDDEAVQRLLGDAARRAGYISGDEYRGSHRAPYKDEEGYHKSMDDVVGMYPEDLYDNNGWRIYGYGDQANDYKAWSIIKRVRNNPDAKVTVYRAVSADVKESEIRNGDWVTPVREYAEQHAKRINGRTKIIEQEVRAGDLYTEGNDLSEWGYDDGKPYAYKNTKNGRKLFEPTYDDDGNLIPLSKRFNSRKNDIRYSLVGGEGESAADRIMREREARRKEIERRAEGGGANGEKITLTWNDVRNMEPDSLYDFVMRELAQGGLKVKWNDTESGTSGLGNGMRVDVAFCDRMACFVSVFGWVCELLLRHLKGHVK